jgi:uncharacterized protein YndB with AHSA1/START domain
VEEFRFFGFRWAHALDDVTLQPSRDVLFELADDGHGRTAVSLCESGFERISDDEVQRRESLEANRIGWDSELDRLVDYVEAKLSRSGASRVE